MLPSGRWIGITAPAQSRNIRPAVASEVGGNPELVRSGQTGLTFPAHDVPALAAVLRRLVEDHQSGRRDYSTPLWTLLMFESFLRNVMGAHATGGVGSSNSYRH